MCGFLWCRQGDWSKTPSHYWQVQWKSRIPSRPSLTPEEGFPHYWWAEVGLPSLQYPSTGTRPSWECLMPVCYVIITNTAADGTSLTGGGDANPDSPLHLPWHHPRREAGAYHYNRGKVGKLGLCWHESGWVHSFFCCFWL